MIHLPLASNQREVVVDERADHEERKLAGKLEGERVVVGHQDAVDDGEREEGPEDGVAMEAAAKPDDDGDGDVEHHLDLDGPEGAVHAVLGVVGEDAGDGTAEEVQEGKVADEEASDMKLAVAEGDEETECRREPVAGEDAGGALDPVVAQGRAALPAGEDEEAGDGEEAFDGEVAAEVAGEWSEDRRTADVSHVEEDDHGGEQQTHDVEVVLSLHENTSAAV